MSPALVLQPGGVPHKCLSAAAVLQAAQSAARCSLHSELHYCTATGDEQCSTAAAIDDALQMAVITNDAPAEPDARRNVPVIPAMFFS